MGKTRDFFTRNNTIVLINMCAATMLLFCVCFFFFSNLNMFLKDITSYMAFSPIILFGGIIFVCFYITSLFFYLFDSKTVWLADRFDLAYKIVFSITLLMLIIRGFLGDFMCTADWCGAENYCHSSIYNVPIPVVATAIISGIITWATPKIKDNDNTEF